MTQEEMIEFDRLKTARDSLLLTVANLRGQIDTAILAEREAILDLVDGYAKNNTDLAEAIRARGQA